MARSSGPPRGTRKARPRRAPLPEAPSSFVFYSLLLLLIALFGLLLWSVCNPDPAPPASRLESTPPPVEPTSTVVAVAATPTRGIVIIESRPPTNTPIPPSPTETSIPPSPSVTPAETGTRTSTRTSTATMTETQSPTPTETATATPTETATVVPSAAAVITHIVQKGDTLKSIAERYGTTVKAILAANTISDPDNLVIGQELTIPPPP